MRKTSDTGPQDASSYRQGTVNLSFDSLLRLSLSTASCRRRVATWRAPTRVPWSSARHDACSTTSGTPIPLLLLPFHYHPPIPAHHLPATPFPFPQVCVRLRPVPAPARGPEPAGGPPAAALRVARGALRGPAGRHARPPQPLHLRPLHTGTSNRPLLRDLHTICITNVARWVMPAAAPPHLPH